MTDWEMKILAELKFIGWAIVILGGIYIGLNLPV